MQSVALSLRDKVNSGVLEQDPVQKSLAERLDLLIETLQTRRLGSKSSALGWLFGGGTDKASMKGLYIWGSVGRGKSMLMDMFFSIVAVKRKKRVHFNDFMADAQDRIQAQRDAIISGATSEEDPIPPVAKQLAEEATLICFDEFTVTDIADATILGRLFTELFSRGTVIVATSNVAPDNLYKDGLNRQRFLPFIDLLKENCEEYQLDAKTDYRLEKLSKAPVYIAPLGQTALKKIDEAWYNFTAGQEAVSTYIKHKGRKILVPRAIDGVARFDFSDLCEKPLAGADYLVISNQFHTIFLENVPIMSSEQRNEAKRFILLIDTLYDRKIKLIISAAANPHALYKGRGGREAFEFQRTASRLIEMQSTDYLSESKNNAK